MDPPSAATALKEANGGKLPDITRKIKACVACRKLKIKCYMTDSRPPCTRCKSRGLSCSVSKSIQMLMESDVIWKEDIRHRVEQLEKQLGGNRAPLLDSNAEAASNPPSFQRNQENLGWVPGSSHMTMTNSTSEIGLNFSCSLGGFPGAALSGQPATDTGHSANTRPDIVTRGIISEATASELYQFYYYNLDHYVYNLLDGSATLSEIRSRSSLLTSAICTVAALCKAASCYEVCLQAFKDEVSMEHFSLLHTFDDVRALCIGSLWLTDVAAAMSTLAVRFASELNLHRCITKMPHKDIKCYNRTRLYFVVVICDHQCALKHGRPPMTRTLRSLRNPRALLRCPFSSPVDIVLISHLELWTLNSRVLDGFGADVGSPFPPEKVKDVKQSGEYLEIWWTQWSRLIRDRNDLHTLSIPVLGLYFHASRVTLFSHVLRGPMTEVITTGFGDSITDEISELAARASESALEYLKCCMANRAELHRHPSYLSTVAAFSCVLLLGMCAPTRAAYLPMGQREEIMNVVFRVSGLFNGLALSMHVRYPLAGMAKSLDAALSDPSWMTQGQMHILQAGFQDSDALSLPPHFQFDPHPQMLGNAPAVTPLAPDIDWTVFPDDFATEFPTVYALS